MRNVYAEALAVNGMGGWTARRDRGGEGEVDGEGEGRSAIRCGGSGSSAIPENQRRHAGDGCEWGGIGGEEARPLHPTNVNVNVYVNVNVNVNVNVVVVVVVHGLPLTTTTTTT